MKDLLMRVKQEILVNRCLAERCLVDIWSLYAWSGLSGRSVIVPCGFLVQLWLTVDCGRRQYS
jgi:hypothetical protein